MNEYNQKLQNQFINISNNFFSLINWKFGSEFSSLIQELTTGLTEIENFCKIFYPLDPLRHATSHQHQPPANVDEVVNLIERNGQLRITI